MPLLSLPLELLTMFANKVSRLEDRKNLRLTCTLLGEVLKPHVLSSVTVNIHGHNVDPGLCLLQALVEEKDATLKGRFAMFSGFSKHIRTLYIDSITTTHYPESDVDLERRQNTFRHTDELEHQERLWHEIEAPSLECEKKLRLYLKPALESLNSLTTFHLRWHWRNLEWTLNTIFDCMRSDQSLHKIQNFSFNHDDRHRDPIRFPYLPDVRRLSLSGHLSKAAFSRLFKHPVMLNNPRLLTLWLSNDHNSDSLRRLSSDTIIPATILDLRLHGFLLPSIEHIMNGSLTCLDLSNSRLSGKDTWALLFEQLSFQKMRLRNLALSDIKTSNDTRKLLDYLSSYSGLESFKFSGIEWYDDYDTHAVYFYTQVLPLHVETLVELELRPMWESVW
ncbi:hypothetical protein EV361DRAFT_518973 [Lentinula raphanica]|nr:hypothetical protein EV361DRAFT_518973 [Lentinula raphanica]